MNLTQQDIQTQSHFVSEEIVETKTTTEAQRSISPIQSNFTTPNLKNPTLQQTIIQSTVKPSVAQKYSQMDYQKFRTVTKPSYKKQTSHRHKFAEHDYNYVNGPKTTKPKTNTQNFFSQNQNIPQPTLNLVNFMINHDPHKNKVKITHFFNKIKILQKNVIPKINLIIMHKIIFDQMMKKTITKIINGFTQAKDLVLTVLTNQIFSIRTHKTNKVTT